MDSDPPDVLSPLPRSKAANTGPDSTGAWPVCATISADHLSVLDFDFNCPLRSTAGSVVFSLCPFLSSASSCSIFFLTRNPVNFDAAVLAASEVIAECFVSRGKLSSNDNTGTTELRFTEAGADSAKLLLVVVLRNIAETRFKRVLRISDLSSSAKASGCIMYQKAPTCWSVKCNSFLRKFLDTVFESRISP